MELSEVKYNYKVVSREIKWFDLWLRKTSGSIVDMGDGKSGDRMGEPVRTHLWHPDMTVMHGLSWQQKKCWEAVRAGTCFRDSLIKVNAPKDVGK